MAFPDGWSHPFKFTIDHTKVAATPSGRYFALVTKDNLPVSVINAGPSSADEGGGDLRFSEDEAGLSPLPCEVMEFHPDAVSGNRKCEVWVGMPSDYLPSDTVDVDIFVWCQYVTVMHQPVPCDPLGSEAVWTGYNAVLHMNDGPASTKLTGLQLVNYPRAIQSGNYVYIGYFDIVLLRGMIARYDVTTGVMSPGVQIYTAPLADAHTTPTLAKDSSGYIYAFTGSHTANNKLRVFKSTNPNDHTSWGSEIVITNTTGNIPAFVQAHCLSDDTLVVFWRKDGSTIARAISTDGGATWTNIQSIWAINTYLPYFTTRIGAGDRVHLSWHIKDGSGNHSNLYYMYSDNAGAATSAWKAIDGTTISVPISSHPTTVSAGRVYDSTASYANGSYLMGFTVDGSNNPYLAIGLFPTTASANEIAVFTYAAGWIKNTVAQAAALNVGSAEHRAEGDIYWRSGTTLRLGFARDVSGKWEMEMWESTNAATTWTKLRDMTTNSRTQNRVFQFVKDTDGSFEGTWFSADLGAAQVELYNTAHDLFFEGDHTAGLAAWARDVYPTDGNLCRDSTANRYHGTKNTSGAKPTESTGLLAGGKGQTFPVNGYISLGNPGIGLTGDGTGYSVEIIVKPDGVSGAQKIIERKESILYSMYIVLNSGKFQGFAHDATSTLKGPVEYATGPSAGQVYKLKLQYDGTTLSIRQNKVEGGTTAAATSPIPMVTTAQMLIGSGNFVGVMDEFRLAPAKFPNANSDTEYENYINPATFASGTDLVFEVGEATLALSGTLGFAGDVSFGTSRSWHMPTSVVDGTIRHMIVLDTDDSILDSGDVTASGGEFVLSCTNTGTLLGTKKLAAVHNWNGSTSSTSIRGGVGLVTVAED